MEEVKRTNVVVIYLQQQQVVFVSRCDLYAIEVDHGSVIAVGVLVIS